MSTPFNKIVARNVRFLRQEKGLTTDELAPLAFMSLGTVSNIENANRKRDVDRNHIEQIAKALGVPSDALTEENPDIQKRFVEIQQAIGCHNYSDHIIQLSKQLIEDTKIRGPRERITALFARGSIDYHLGSYSTSSIYYKQALKIAEEIQDRLLIHKARHNLADASERTGNYEKALLLLNTDMADLLPAEHRAKNYQLLGKTYTNQRLYEEAESSYKKAIEEIRKLQTKQFGFEARCHQLLGDLYRETRRYTDARCTSEQAIHLSKQANDHLCEVYAIRTIVLTHIDEGDRDAAIEDLHPLVQIIEALRLNTVEYHKTMFYLHWCHNDYGAMTASLSELEKHDMPPREIAKMYERCGETAMQLNLFHEAERLYKKAINVLLN